MKNCLNCNEDISMYHGRTLRCPPCKKEYTKEWFRNYMAKRNLAKRWENRVQRRSENDLNILNNNHMTGLGTFHLTKRREDLEKEYEDIKKLKKYAGI